MNHWEDQFQTIVVDRVLPFVHSMKDRMLDPIPQYRNPAYPSHRISSSIAQSIGCILHYVDSHIDLQLQNRFAYFKYTERAHRADTQLTE